MKPYDPYRDNSEPDPTTNTPLTPANPNNPLPSASYSGSTAADPTIPLKTVETEQMLRDQGQIVVPLVEENLLVNKQWVEAGAVVIRKEVETRTETVPVEVGYEEVHVERVPANIVLGEGEMAQTRQEGNTWIIPVIQEELVVVKRRVVREEIRVTKRPVGRQQQITDTVRAERVSIETSGSVESLGNEGDGPRQT